MFSAPTTQRRVLIVSNRLPIKVRRDGTTVHIERSVGGLASGLRPVHEGSPSLWIGTTGDKPSRAERSVVEARLRELRCVNIDLTRAETKTFYEHISNAVLWPLVHDRLDQLPLTLDGWDVYEQVNRRFAETIAQLWKPGDLVWVHDYHLMRVPALLRQMLPEAAIGFFMHVPFPNPELFLVLPVRRWLVEGMLGADVIGFHTRRYRGHFTAAVRRLLHLEMDADEHVRYANRAVRLGIYPIGVAARELQDLAVRREVSSAVLALRAPRQRLLLGVDRLDYTKGIARRLLSFERLLAKHEEWQGHARLMQIAVPSRGNLTAYKRYRREIERLVTRINGRFATPTWTPIQYIHRALGVDELLALYRAADVMLVTPVRDGMNLVAKEFVASRTDEDGVLLLSEFAGAAAEMEDAVIVNPYDIDGVADAIHQALVMPAVDRRQRMRTLRAQVMTHDVERWANEFLHALEAHQRGSDRRTPAPVR